MSRNYRIGQVYLEGIVKVMNIQINQKWIIFIESEADFTQDGLFWIELILILEVDNSIFFNILDFHINLKWIKVMEPASDFTQYSSSYFLK